MFGFDKMFDFNGNGQLDSWERAAQLQFMDEMSRNEERSCFDDDDENDLFSWRSYCGYNGGRIDAAVDN